MVCQLRSLTPYIEGGGSRLFPESGSSSVKLGRCLLKQFELLQLTKHSQTSRKPCANPDAHDTFSVITRCQVLPRWCVYYAISSPVSYETNAISFTSLSLSSFSAYLAPRHTAGGFGFMYCWHLHDNQRWARGPATQWCWSKERKLTKQIIDLFLRRTMTLDVRRGSMHWQEEADTGFTKSLCDVSCTIHLTWDVFLFWRATSFGPK